MSGIPKAWQTSWAQEAIKAERDRPADRYQPPRADPKDSKAVPLEGDRIDQIKAASLPPIECGPDVVLIAPARGPVVGFYTREMVPDPKRDGHWKSIDMGYRGRATMRQQDVFDVMMDQAHKRDANKKGAKPPFTIGQISAARDFRDLTQRVHAFGVKCQSLDHIGGGGGDAMDAYMRDADRLRRMKRAIGGEMVLRKVRPSKRGTRATIWSRDLMYMVCIQNNSISDVLKAHKWSSSKENIKALRRALCAILDRLWGL